MARFEYYLRHSMLLNEEGQHLEFKGHRAFAPEDVNQLNKDKDDRHTRQVQFSAVTFLLT